MTVEVLSPGLLSTIQDLGRSGIGSLGVSRGGAMDPFAARAANLLVGNPEDAAVLECTLAGPRLRFAHRTVVAVTGSRFDHPWPHEEAWPVEDGDELDLGRSVEGARCYLAVAGGLRVDPVLGSASSHVAAGLGSPPLRKGALIETGPGPVVALRRLRSGVLPGYASEASTRVVAGPQDDAFRSEGLRTLLTTPWTVSQRADRTGVRLEGPALPHAAAAEVDPQGLPHGAIQVPGDGAPIVMGADRPATGGYPVIATVIAADLGSIAHAKPGDRLTFRAVDRDEARAAWRERDDALRAGIEPR